MRGGDQRDGLRRSKTSGVAGHAHEINKTKGPLKTSEPGSGDFVEVYQRLFDWRWDWKQSEQ